MTGHTALEKDAVVHLELHGRHCIVYRVIARTVMRFGRYRTVYGVETAHVNGYPQEELVEFSDKLPAAVAFARYLHRNGVRPGYLYPQAHAYLRAGGRR